MRVLTSVLLAIILPCGSAFSQGELTPPGPPGPTQTSLQAIWDDLQTLKTDLATHLGVPPVVLPAQGGALMPTGAPAPTQKTLQSIWDELQFIKTSVDALECEESPSGVVILTANDIYNQETANYVRMGLFPINGAEPVATGTTGDVGHLEFYGVASGTYRLRAMDPYYTQSSIPTFDVADGQTTMLTLSLRRVPLQRTVRILDATTSTPIVGATVMAKRNADVLAEGTTNLEGEVVLGGLPMLIEGDATLVLSVTKAGHFPTSRVIRPSPIHTATTVLYMLSSSRTMPQVVEGRVVGEDRGDEIASIMGYIVSYENNPEVPLEGVRVSLDDPSIPPVYTDAQGYYYFSNLENTRLYTVTAERLGSISETAEVRALVGLNRSLSYTYLFSELKARIHLNELGGEELTATMWTSPPTRRRIGNDDIGYFNILDGSDFPVGMYLLRASCPGFRNTYAPPLEVSRLLDGTIIFVPSDTVGISLVRLYLGGIIRDAQTGEPIPGVSVSTEPATLNVTTDSNGQFHIVGGSGVLPGTTSNLVDNRTYTFVLSKSGYEQVAEARVRLYDDGSPHFESPPGLLPVPQAVEGINDLEFLMSPAAPD